MSPDKIRIDAPPAVRPSAGVPNPSRRAFLKVVCAGAAVAALGPAAAQASSEGGAAADARAMLIDLTRCTGCNSCSVACALENGLDNDGAPTALDSNVFSFIDTHEVPCNDELLTCYVKRQCMHCVHPACVSVCTVGALRKTAEGPVVYDSAKCIGCRYCQYACPFGVPTYEWEDALGLIGKCEMCKDRLAEGQSPACVAACPNGALRFGRRSALLAQAHAQIESNPGRYIDHVYGEFEVGGTSMLYLSPVPFDALGLPVLGATPIPQTAEAVMKKTPVVAGTVAALATALYLGTRMRSRRVEFVPSGDAAHTSDGQNGDPQ
jgi:formate dehydrogenase iron-sulfur subunit